MSRIYLDWNATTPLRPEARAAMIAAMDVTGNPSSVHGEGRAATAIVERARAQLADAMGASAADIVFTATATEAAALALKDRGLESSPVEHSCITAWTETSLSCDNNGLVDVVNPQSSTMQMVNSETGVVQPTVKGLAVSDYVQALGKMPVAFDWSETEMAILSAHKLGGPKGVGALVLRQGIDLQPQIIGGGQEMGRRAGTENVIGIAGFGAAAEAAARDLDSGVWDEVRSLRDLLEQRLTAEAPDLVIFGHDQTRLANTSYFAVPGWKGETQVMQMDMAGFAVSAGSACSSGKVKASQVLLAMGVEATTAASAIRVSLGPSSTKDQVMKFADIWLAARKRFQARAA